LLAKTHRGELVALSLSSVEETGQPEGVEVEEEGLTEEANILANCC
jgi:hypothetical protein